MLGMARASEYAGWWTRGSPILQTSLTVTSTVAQPFLISPRYYADMSGSTDNTNTSPVFVYPSGATTTMDMTGVPNQPKRTVSAMTFRVGTNWMTTAPTTGNTDGLVWFNNMNNAGTDSFYSCGISLLNNVYQFRPSSFGTAITMSPSTFSTYRNRWLGLVCATSDSTSTFANWTGTGTNTYSWAQRSVLYDLENRTVIATADSYATQAVGTVDLTQAWNFGFATGTYYSNMFFNLTNPSTYYRYDCQIASGWHCMGETMDPAVYATQMLGSGISATVNGVRAWGLWASDGAGTTSGNQTTELIGNWDGARMPSSNVVVARNAGQILPVFTSF